MMVLDESFVVIDFETTGLFPNNGDRAIEIGAILVKNGKIVDEYQSLINPEIRISPFIESYTGITNGMLKKANPANIVMEEFLRFAGGRPLIAHNMAFDKRFLEMELNRLGKVYSSQLGCSLLLSRRVFPDLKSHNLASLVSHCRVRKRGNYHRALSDSYMTAKVWLKMEESLKEKFKLEMLSFEDMLLISRTSKYDIDRLINNKLRKKFR